MDREQKFWSHWSIHSEAFHVQGLDCLMSEQGLQFVNLSYFPIFFNTVLTLELGLLLKGRIFLTNLNQQEFKNLEPVTPLSINPTTALQYGVFATRIQIWLDNEGATFSS